ncbi:hypothetical protein [Nocardia salmonicida]|uniref:hypothetical protein n=1 Tax=Nocardia salmonicida TaxID=53431 RepID=UPI000AA9725F|nr:hypothetical protein [Nocardia salmonicida]
MGNRKVSGYAAEVLKDPEAWIIAAIHAAEPTLPAAECAAAITEAAASVAPRRRLGQALFEDPQLLVSQKPTAPPVLDRLIQALQRRGATRVRLPRCGNCQREVKLTNRDGDLRICAPCEIRRRRAGQVCARCGHPGWSRYRDWAGRSFCYACDLKLREVDQLDRLIAQVSAASPAADIETVREVLLRALPTEGTRRRVADELADHPARLMTEATAATAATMRLLLALVDANVVGFAAPPCAFCGRNVALKEVREGRRCCRRCYDEHRFETCDRCGFDRPVASRTAAGAALCLTCYNKQPENQAKCPGCGEQGRLVNWKGQEPRCRRCQRAPVTICAFCGKLKQCYFANTPSPRCEPCSSKLLHREICSRCEKFSAVSIRTADGAPICKDCARRKATCRDCHRVMFIGGTCSDGPRCKACYRKHPESFQACQSCGSLERLHHFGLCKHCACIELLHQELGDNTGIIPRLQPVFTALARSSADSALTYLEYGGGSRLLRDLRDTGQPITHQLLDGFRSQPALRSLRDAMVSAGLLEPRDEVLHSLEEHLYGTIAEVVDGEERRLLRSYATWKLLRRLRTQSPARPITRPQAKSAQVKLNTVLVLLDFLHQNQRRLDDADQQDLDLWQASYPLAHIARDFLRWAIERRVCRPGLSLAPPPQRQHFTSISDDGRWTLARMLLQDNSIDRCDRFSGLLLLLFAQPASRIVKLRTDAVVQRIDDRSVCLILGSEPIRLPQPLDDLALDLVLNRYRGRAALARVADHDWLFPGLRAGSPISSHYLNQRLKLLGIPAQAARNTALMDLAGQLPAAVLSALLGIDVTTAQDWVNEVGQQGAYAAELVRRARMRDH